MKSQAPEPKHSNKIVGIWYATGAFVLWGILPLYWKALDSLSAIDILAHRILWSFVFVIIVLAGYGRLAELKCVVANKRNWLVAFIGSILISANWYIYIWAVNANHVVEASLGYYINPLIVVILGVVVLKEKLNFWQVVSLILATIGVVITTVHYGKIPWVAISLALTFGLYGLVKKLGGIESIISLGMETLLATPAALFYLMRHTDGFGLGDFSPTVIIMLICSGIVTSIPLIWFARGAKLAPLSTIGFIQYLSPTISLILGILIFKEPFSHSDMISFGFIWTALIIYSISGFQFMSRVKIKRAWQENAGDM